MDSSTDNGAGKSPAPSSQKETLRLAEWLLTITLLLLIATLFTIAKIHSCLLGAPLARPPLIEVSVEGQVTYPGVYSIEKGTPLEEVLRKVKPKRLANLKEIQPGARVLEPLHLVIGELTELAVRLEGAVQEPGEVRVPIGSRISDLK
ncbi:MAG: SLBB domain-containing protein, partial [Verrucomicrobiota bacterium]|nr:SLBB domain-containing protein [Verrucomicrobiota bacterium]